MTKFNPHKSTLAVTKITILVVDDDATSLTVVAAMLRERYEVTTVKSPHDALSTLRTRPGIDLVVTDLHMPGMDGLQLKKQIDDEFKLPVIIMSSDDEESVILQSLACGAVLYIVKPVNPDDLKNVWQYAVQAKKGKSPIIKEIGSLQEELEPEQDYNDMSITDDHFWDTNSGASSVSDDDNKRAKKHGKRKRMGRNGNDSEKKSAVPKKAKVVWTNSLHNRFLQAIRHIGLEKAVPKKILDCMNVSGLTRENVASHLQKYRLFLKRVAEKGLCPSKVLTERALRSNFATGHVMMLQQQQMKGLNNSHPGYGGSNMLTTTLNPNPNLLTLRFPGQGAFSSINNTSPPGPGLPNHQFRYGQSNLQHNQANRQQPLLGNASSCNYQANQTDFGVGLSNFENNFSTNGGFSSGMNNPSFNGLINGTNLSPRPTHPQQGTQARLNLHNVGNGFTSTAQFQFGASTLHNSTSASNPNSHNGSYTGTRMTANGEFAIGHQIQFNNSIAPNPNSLGGSYSGTRMASNGEFGVGQMQFNNNIASNSNSLSGSYLGTMMTGVHGSGNMNNGTCNGSAGSSAYGNGNMNNVAPMLRNLNSGNLGQGSFLSAGFGQVPNQVSPTIPLLATTNNQQAPMPEGLSTLGTGGEKDSNFNFQNNASIFDENVDNLFDSTNFEFPLQHQGEENVLNPNIVNSSNPDGLNQIANQILNPNLTGTRSFSINGGDQLENNSTTANSISPLGEYYPSNDQNANQQQSRGENIVIYPMNNASQNYQSWSDEFMDDCFSSCP
ncbi:hypothetical protein SLEP1_g17083 [Rubroshorea leprosula]|uniref:Two-component response regulator n=1 Tax=Rubroshorea leprosula TaxID=152421 RepID=A0AAV5J0P7_9ROSI|nr:hypothetical protein SLEP1_g17083 [Rubroshorea leprosula]